MMSKWFLLFFAGVGLGGALYLLELVITRQPIEGAIAGVLTGLGTGYLAGYFAAKEDTEKVIE